MSPLSFKINDHEISDPGDIANRFCEYFTNVGPNLAKNIPATSQTRRSFRKEHFVSSFFFATVSQLEVSNLISDLRTGTAAGFDNVPVDIVKKSADIISQPLTHIINLSIQTGSVPDQMKIARVIPIFKSGDEALFSNYCPVSVLPVFSKLLDKT